MQTATVLKECLPGNTTNHFYIIMIHEEDKLLQLYQSQSDDPEPSALGILTSKQLPHSLVSDFTHGLHHSLFLQLLTPLDSRVLSV